VSFPSCGIYPFVSSRGGIPTAAAEAKPISHWPHQKDVPSGTCAPLPKVHAACEPAILLRAHPPRACLGLKNIHPFDGVVARVRTQYPRVGEGSVGFDTESVLVCRIGRIVKERALHKIAQLELSQFG